MQRLSKIQRDEIIAYDLKERAEEKHFPNRTRIYTYLTIKGEDVEIRAVATIRKKEKIFLKEVIRTSVDSKRMYIKDLIHAMMVGYSVDWSPEGAGREHNWSYEGKWGSEPYNHRQHLWNPTKTVINPNVIFTLERFKYCAWVPSCGNILDYLKAYVNHPKLEMLSKIGAGWYAQKPGFVKQLEKNKLLLRFFLNNVTEILAHHYGVDVIWMAYRKNMPLKEAHKRIDTRRKFHVCGLPTQIDPMRAMNYVVNNLLDIGGYSLYLNYCLQLGMNLNDSKVVYPKSFQQRYDIVRAQAAELKRRKDAEESAAMDKMLLAVAEKFARLESTHDGFVVILPKCCADLIYEGEKLDNCLGEGYYAERIARGECVIAFVHDSKDPAVPFVAVEYCLEEKQVVQCYMISNQKPPDEVITFVNKVFEKAA